MPIRKDLSEGYRLLEYYIDNDIIWWEPSEQQYIGIAADGEVVGLANTEEQLASILSVFPIPHMW